MRLGIVAHRLASTRVLTTFMLVLVLAPPLRAQAATDDDQYEDGTVTFVPTGKREP